ncbi:FAD-dependent monooxygenase [Arthrobacter sp. NPDC080031]|uniref:FAD binding domain-containing protein n=1 Tax=Arthrobacter sp. NPDC080031 TaxID=3155918 RepID=UPI00344D5704
MGKGTSVKALIIGGSVAGLAAAHELRAAGVESEVFERSSGTMQTRGAGVVMQPEVEALLRGLGFTAESVSVELFERQQLHRTGEATGYAAPQLMTSWDTLYRTLRDSLPADSYRLNSTLHQLRTDGNQIRAEFADGSSAVGDFVVGADGIGSATRKLVNPEARETVYAGYVAWRGLEPEAMLPQDLVDLLSGRFTFYGANGLQFLSYLVPGPNGELTQGKRRVNWVWYMNVPEQNLRHLLKGKSGRQYTTFLPPGELDGDSGIQLAAVARSMLPPQLGDLVQRLNVFMQPIFDLPATRMSTGRTALIGDAAGTVRPHTASGTSKAFGDARGLAIELQRFMSARPSSLQDRLGDWERNRHEHLGRLSDVGIELARRSSLGTTIGSQYLTEPQSLPE